MYVYEMLGAELLSNLYDRLGRQLMDPQQSAVWQVTSELTPYFLAPSCKCVKSDLPHPDSVSSLDLS